jgi:AraC-like DNA-binding protein
MKNKYPTVVSGIINFMTENLGRNIDIETIASENNMSISNLNKIFQKYTGVPPYRFFLDKKLQWAEQLLLNTSMTVKEVAYRTGFENPLYFSNSFSKKFSLSPHNYRKSYSI